MVFVAEFGVREYLYLQVRVSFSLQVRSVGEKSWGIADAGCTNAVLQMEKRGCCCLETCLPELSLSQVPQLLAHCFPQF